MKTQLIIQECAKDLMEVSGFFSGCGPGNWRIEKYLTELAGINRDFHEILVRLAELQEAQKEDRGIQNELHRVAISALELYTKFKRKNLNWSLKHAAHSVKIKFGANKQYSERIRTIKDTERRLSTKDYEIHEKCGLMRTLAQEYKALGQEKLIQNPTIVVISIGVLIALFTLIKSFY